MSDVMLEHKGFIPEHRDPQLYEKIRDAVVTGISGNRLRSKDYRLQLQNNIGQLVSTVISSHNNLKPNIQVLVNYIDRDESVIDRPTNGNGNSNAGTKKPPA